MFVTAHHGADVASGAREINLREEVGAVGESGAMLPFKDVAAAGVVISEGVGKRIVGVEVAFEKFFEIPRTDKSVGGGIEKLPGRKRGKMFGLRPIFRGGRRDDLHQSDFTAAAASTGIETALAPDDGFDQRGVHGVTAGGGENGDVLAVVAPLIPPPIAAHPRKEQGERECSSQQAFHGGFVAGKRTPTKGN